MDIILDLPLLDPETIGAIHVHYDAPASQLGQAPCQDRVEVAVISTTQVWYVSKDSSRYAFTQTHQHDLD